MSADVIVVGAGISGLSCAWGLERAGLSVHVLEAGPRAGGTIGSTREQGCLYETGPNSTLDTTPLIARMLDELGIAGERQDASPAAKNRYILHHGKLVPLPMSPPAFLRTPLFSLGAKLRLLREPFIEKSAADSEESVAAFVRRRLGPEFLDRAINPFVAGVYAGDPEKLSVRAAFPKLHALEQQYGSLIRGQIKGAKARKASGEQSKQTATMFAFKDGMQTLPDAIARRLARLDTRARVRRLAMTKAGWQAVVDAPGGGREYDARAIVLAVPAYAAASLVSPYAITTAGSLEDIRYPPVGIVASLYRKGTIAHPLDGFGFLVPQVEGRRVLGTIFSSTLFSGRAPDGYDLLTTFVGGMRQPDQAKLPAAELAAMVQAEHASILGAPPQAESTRVVQWERAIPQYTAGHLERIANIESTEHDRPGLFFCANYRGGVSVGDCIKAADAMATRVAGFLRGA